MSSYYSNYNSKRSGSSGSSSKEDYRPTVYSAVRMTNSVSMVDPSSISFSYWKNMICLTITPYKNNAVGSMPEYDSENAVKIYLTPSKAMLLSNYLKFFKENPDTYENVGVNTLSSIIFITDGTREFGEDKKGLYIIVKGIDENGNETSSISYQFVTDNSNYYGIANYRGGKNFRKDFEFCQYHELNMIISVLDNFVNAVGGAYAYSVIDCNRFNKNRILNSIASIQDKLGIEHKNGNGNGGSYQRNSTSFFDSNNGSSSSEITNMANEGLEEFNSFVQTEDID